MNFIHEFLSERILQSLGWTFIHSLWQGAIVALILGFMLTLFKKHAASVRYTLAVLSLAALFILSVMTFVRYFTSIPGNGNPAVAGTIPVPGEALIISGGSNTTTLNEAAPITNGVTGLFEKLTGYFTLQFPLVVSLWFLGMVLFLVKMVGGLIYSERIRFVGITPFPETWTRKISALKSKMKISRPVKLVESCLVRVPMVIGFIKPVILIPLGALSGIPRDQVEAIIAHELAHIRRNDFLVNIFQSIVESIFFFHPAAWWMSRIIRREREHCCDDLAVSVCNESVVYAKALANLQERYDEAPSYAVAMAKSRYSLLSRIRRLNQKKVNGNNPAEKWITLVVMILIISCFSLSFKITGSDRVLAAVNPGQETNLELGMIPFVDVLEGRPFELQDTLKKSDTSTIKTRFFDASDQKEKEVKMILEGGLVKELYVDGERVPEEEMPQYQELIDNTLAELKEAEIELEKAEKELEEAQRSLDEIDMERIDQDLERAKEEIERAMHEFKEQDWANVKQEMEQALQQIRKSLERLEFHDFEEKYHRMQMDFEQFRHDFDTSKINRELQQSMREIERSMQEFNQQFSLEMREQMEEARRAIRESMEEIQRIREIEYREQSEWMDRERMRQREESETLRKEREEEIRRERELQRDEMAQNRQMQERERELQREAREQEMEEIRRVREMEIQERMAREKNQTIQAIEKQLMEDGFYSEGEPIDFELSAKQLRINGKKQPGELFEKYKKIYEEREGSIPQTATITIKK